MEVVYLTDKRDYKQFLKFKLSLYKGDKNYVDTTSFVLEDVLFQKTDFTKSCKVFPVLVKQNNKILAQAIFIYNSKLPYLQVGFFEAEENAQSAVNALIDGAKLKAKQLGVEKIVIGLNAHISYGVGLLTSGFEFKNSFDSWYNKSYYQNYFTQFEKQTLSTYKLNSELSKNKFERLNDKNYYKIEYADMNDFQKSAERMRALCEKTISKTFLYFSTEKNHFYELMKDLKPFLKPENLMFAVDKKGNDAGFIFWHPDFNQMLKGGEKISGLKILLGYIFNKNKIDTLKINAIGSLSPNATYALITRLYSLISPQYKFLETNFVWDNNLASSAINKRFFGTYHRKYEVYILNAND